MFLFNKICYNFFCKYCLYLYRPWIKQSSWVESYVMKHLNYETEQGFIDLNNPLQLVDDSDIRKPERIKKKKNKADKIKDFKVTEEGITDMNEGTQGNRIFTFYFCL